MIWPYGCVCVCVMHFPIVSARALKLWNTILSFFLKMLWAVRHRWELEEGNRWSILLPLCEIRVGFAVYCPHSFTAIYIYIYIECTSLMRGRTASSMMVLHSAQKQTNSHRNTSRFIMHTLWEPPRKPDTFALCLRRTYSSICLPRPRNNNRIYAVVMMPIPGVRARPLQTEASSMGVRHTSHTPMHC